MRPWLLAALLLAAACGKQDAGAPEGGAPQGSETAPMNTQSWNVYKNGRKVLTVKNEPGPITSTAALPPGKAPRRHPFLSAQALDPAEENDLGMILEESKSFEDFMARLKAAGYAASPAP